MPEKASIPSTLRKAEETFLQFFSAPSVLSLFPAHEERERISDRKDTVKSVEENDADLNDYACAHEKANVIAPTNYFFAFVHYAGRDRPGASRPAIDIAGIPPVRTARLPDRHRNIGIQLHLLTLIPFRTIKADAAPHTALSVTPARAAELERTQEFPADRQLRVLCRMESAVPAAAGFDDAGRGDSGADPGALRGLRTR